MDKKVFGRRVHDARKRAKLTSDQMADLCDCTPVSIRQIESGARLPSVPKLVCICNILKVTPNHLLNPELTFTLSETMDGDCDERLEEVITKLRHLSSTQINMICATFEALIEHM